MKTKFANLTMIVFIVGAVGFTDSDAAVYKWRDKNGKVFFTDDPGKVPEAFRKNPLIKDSKNPRLRQKEPPTKESKIEKTSEPEKSENDKPEGLTEGQRSTAEAVIYFLKEDISRYKKFNSWPASRSKFRQIKKTVAGATPSKQALLGQVSSQDLPLFKEFSGFLEISIAEDEKSQQILPTTITSRRQTQALMNRLESEAGQEVQLLEKLTLALTEDDAAKAQSKKE